ncbi:hypothetical protein OG978_32530 [Streptomyces sp. NBC_01591]|uniref:hypothetical protein n=1 Tax=Streptomyces sp. NBC_01591 TaxID=2975888 RepID=UPI002DD97D06|nr:hypothetical protein [Streptomyces sp. NBC_01591]WSD71701.1 hypothetical protein OG978_32530 [Streptomyces sp. NBC_01591]
MAALRVIVSPPSPTGGRRVRVDGQILGLAYGLGDLVEFLRRAGLEGLDEEDVARSELVEWRGGGPDVWSAPAP